MRFLEWGRIVKGVNTTTDVGANEIPRQAKKFGNTVDKDGRPPTLSSKVKGKSTNVLFNLGLTEGIKLQFQRGEDFDTLHIKPKNKNRVELRGKPGYESGGYDAQDKLHQVLDRLGKAANFSELMNGEVVSINPNHPDGARAKKTAQDILSTEAQEVANSTKIYVDMDGVLADFFTEWGKLMGKDDWRDIGQENIPAALEKIKQTENFWLDLPLTSNAKNLLNLIKDVKGSYTILSSPLPGDPNSEPHKREWIEKHLQFFPPEEVLIRHDKETFATQQDGTPNILIDDYGVNIQKWEAAGGVGFKHKDHKFERTAQNLKQHMQEPVSESIIVEHPAVIAALYAAGTTVRELVKRYGLKAVRQALDKLKKQRANTQRPANDHGGPIDDLIAASKRTRTPDEIARAQQMNLPRALDNAKAMIRTTSRDFRAGKLSREEFNKIMQYVRHNFRNKTGRDLPIEDFLKLTEKWSAKYKRSINCSNPKGFSQKAHCAGRKKNEGAEITMWTNPEYQGSDVDDEYYEKQPVKRVDVSKLTPFEPADKMDDPVSKTNMDNLVKAIEAGKKIKPIVIVQHEDKWLIVDGHHRYFAHLKAGADKIRAVIADPKDLTWRDDVPESVKENFADGKKKGKSRPGRVKRSGASCNGSVTALRKKAKNSSGERARMYHWCANMKSGRKKS